MSHLSALPISAQLRFVKEAWEREKKMRAQHLSGKNRDLKMEEADQCLECCANIYKAFIEMKTKLDAYNEPKPQA